MPSSQRSTVRVIVPVLAILLFAGTAAAQTAHVRFQPAEAAWQVREPGGHFECDGPCEHELAPGEHRFELVHSGGRSAMQRELRAGWDYVLSARRAAYFPEVFSVAVAAIALGAGIGSGVFFGLGDDGAGAGLLTVALVAAVTLALDIVDRAFPSGAVQLEWTESESQRSSMNVPVPSPPVHAWRADAAVNGRGPSA